MDPKLDRIKFSMRRKNTHVQKIFWNYDDTTQLQHIQRKLTKTEVLCHNKDPHWFFITANCQKNLCKNKSQVHL